MGRPQCRQVYDDTVDVFIDVPFRLVRFMLPYMSHERLVLGIDNIHFFCIQYEKRAGPQIIQISLHQCLPDVGLAAAGKNDAVHFIIKGHEAGTVASIHGFFLIVQRLVELFQVHVRQLLTGQPYDGPFESQAHKTVFFNECRVDFRNKGPPLGQNFHEPILG